MISLCKFLFIYFLIIIIILCPEYLIPAAKLDWEILRWDRPLYYEKLDQLVSVHQ